MTRHNDDNLTALRLLCPAPMRAPSKSLTFVIAFLVTLFLLFGPFAPDIEDGGSTSDFLSESEQSLSESEKNLLLRSTNDTLPSTEGTSPLEGVGEKGPDVSGQVDSEQRQDGAEQQEPER